MDLLHKPLVTGAEDDEKQDPPARWDYEVAAENMRAYRTKRGRVCEFPGCDTKLRYTRRYDYCSVHENTEEALKNRSKPGPKPGQYASPKVPGLRPAREAQGLSRRELAKLVGRSEIWVARVERGVHGAPDEPRRRLVEVLEVTEAELFEGEFTKGRAGRPKGSK